MRGLVAVLGLAIATLAVLVVIGVQVVAPAVVATAVRGSAAFAGKPVDVQVRTSLAGVLLHGWIDEVTVAGAGFKAAPLAVGRLTLTATEVGIIDRSIGRLDGSLTDVTLTTLAGTDVRLGNAALDGSTGQATIVGTILPAALEAALAAELQPLGIAAPEVRLVRGEIRIVIAGRQDVAALRLAGGALVLDSGGGRQPITLLQSPADGSWQLTDVVVSAAGARVTVAVNLARLGLG